MKRQSHCMHNRQKSVAALSCIVLALVLFAHAVPLDSSVVERATAPDQGGYKIEKPGTITFTVGVTIKGKVEKPQVVIFLPKEKSQYEPMNFERSFATDIMNPAPLNPDPF
jgi:hypothetical protein